MISVVNALLRDEQGATAVEYGLLLALIAMAALVAIKGIGTGLTALFNNVGASL